MNNTKRSSGHVFFRSTFILILAWSLVGCASSPPPVEERPVGQGDDPATPLQQPDAMLQEMEVHFIDSGQSDAIVIKANNQYMMIDSGDPEDDAIICNYLKKLGVRELEYLILTHYHADHIGAADSIVNAFQVNTVLVPNGDANTKVYRDFITSLSNQGLAASVPLENVVFSLGKATFTILNTKGGQEDENDDSLVVHLTYGTDTFLFTGDASSKVEDRLKLEDVDLVKLGHHGSKTSTSMRFLAQTKPEIAVLTVGADNTYGHPHQEVIERLQSKKIPLYRTDESGSLVFRSNGNGIVTDSKVGSYNAGGIEVSPPEKDENESEPQRFQNCTELRKVYPNGVSKDHPAYQVKMDRDKDGFACET
ncbi:MAG: MBL fold metallo-hydrolase [Erysipelotrichaceae bacterium]